MKRRWILTPCERELAQFLADSLAVHPIVGTLLVCRGIADVHSGKRFLNRKLSDLHDPELLPGASAAADRVYQAIQDKKSICIYGDYDVDGMCATAILLECLRLGGVQPRFYVPDRMEEGYGVNSDALRRLRSEGVDLVITVDCGISSIEQAQVAKEIGLEYIVTDHHEFTATLPEAAVCVHPRLPGSRYPFGDLCGTGVAFKLAWEIARRISGDRRTTPQFQQFLLNATSLAAIGTICDMVPLIDENRVLVHHGLQSLKRTPTIGLDSLMQVSELKEKERLTTGDVGFGLGPRLNACGRLGTARLGVELLTTRDRMRAMELARYLDVENKTRQTLERRIYNDAKAMAIEKYQLDSDGDCAAIVLASKEWHQGVIGIVASRMVEKFHRPCVLISVADGKGTGSCRSIDGFHLQQSLEACAQTLLRCGGHAMAAGLSILEERIEEFAELFHQHAEVAIQSEMRKGTLRIDAEVPLHMLNPALIRALEVIEPFGFSNPSPVFMATQLQVVGTPKCVGGGERHLSFKVQQGGCVKKAIAFNQADRIEELMSQQGKCCVVFSPSVNNYRGFVSVDLLVKDFRPGSRVHNEEPAVCPSL